MSVPMTSSSVPPIDRLAPSQVEHFTFALG